MQLSFFKYIIYIMYNYFLIVILKLLKKVFNKKKYLYLFFYNRIFLNNY